MLIQIKLGNTKIFLDYSLLQPRTGIWIERSYGKKPYDSRWAFYAVKLSRINPFSTNSWIMNLRRAAAAVPPAMILFVC